MSPALWWSLLPSFLACRGATAFFSDAATPLSTFLMTVGKDSALAWPWEMPKCIFLPHPHLAWPYPLPSASLFLSLASVRATQAFPLCWMLVIAVIRLLRTILAVNFPQTLRPLPGFKSCVPRKVPSSQWILAYPASLIFWPLYQAPLKSNPTVTPLAPASKC